MRCIRCKKDRSSKFYINEFTGEYNPKMRVCIKCRVERSSGVDAARSICSYAARYDRSKELHFELSRSGHKKRCKSCGQDKSFGDYSVGRAVCKDCRKK